MPRCFGNARSSGVSLEVSRVNPYPNPPSSGIAADAANARQLCCLFGAVRTERPPLEPAPNTSNHLKLNRQGALVLKDFLSPRSTMNLTCPHSAPNLISGVAPFLTAESLKPTSSKVSKVSLLSSSSKPQLRRPPSMRRPVT